MSNPDFRTSSQLPYFSNVSVIKHGRGVGHLLGGNLSVYTSLIGTPFMPFFKGAVLILEDVGEAMYRLDRLQSQLENAGIFREISGLMFGSFSNIKDEESKDDVKQLVLSYSRKTSCRCPSIFGMPFGHEKDNATLPLGAKISIDTQQGHVRFEIIESVVV